MTSKIKFIGDAGRLEQDRKKLEDINSRQGSSLLLDVISDSVAIVVSKFNLSESETLRIRDSLVSELNESIQRKTTKGNSK